MEEGWGEFVDGPGFSGIPEGFGLDGNGLGFSGLSLGGVGLGLPGKLGFSTGSVYGGISASEAKSFEPEPCSLFSFWLFWFLPDMISGGITATSGGVLDGRPAFLFTISLRVV